MAFKGPSDYIVMRDSDGLFFVEDSDMSISDDLYHLVNIQDPRPSASSYWGNRMAVTSGNIFMVKDGSNIFDSTKQLYQGESVIMFDHSGAYGDSADAQAFTYGALRNEFKPNYVGAINSFSVAANDGLLAYAHQISSSSNWNQSGAYALEVFDTQTGDRLWGKNEQELGASSSIDIQGAINEDSVAIGCGRVVVGFDGNGSFVNEGRVAIFDYEGNKVHTGLIKYTDALPGASYQQKDTLRFGHKVYVKHGRIVVVSYGGTSYQNSNANDPIISIFDLDGKFINAISSNDLYGENSNHGNFGPRVMVGCGRIVIVGKTINGRSPLFFATMDGFIYKKIDRSSFYVYHPCTVAGGKLYNLAGSSGSERVNVFDMNGNGLFTIEHSEIVNTDGNSYSGVLDKIKGFGNTLLLGTPLDDVDFSNSGSAWMVRVKTDADNIWETILEKIY